MKCPHCHAEINDDSRFCTVCGAALPEKERRGARRQETEAAFAGTGLVLGNAARRARLEAIVEPGALIGTRTYNAILVVVLLWGLFVNVLLCTYAGGFVESLNPIVLLIGYCICAFAGIFIAGRSSNPAVSFVGYNLVVIPFGLMLTVVVGEYGGVEAAIVRDAFLYTLLITLGMLAAVMIVPGFFAKLGGALLGCLFGLIICEVFLLIFRVNQNVTDWIAAGLFSLYIGYDIYRSQQFPKTVDNAVDSALDIYLDIANLFLRVLSIMGKRKN